MSIYENASQVAAARVCLVSFSKNVRGELQLRARAIETCPATGCKRLQLDHAGRLDVRSNEPCDKKPSPSLDGVLGLDRLVTLYTGATTRLRGFHAADFNWSNLHIKLTGNLAGLTNTSAHRRKGECVVRNAMEGRLTATVGTSDDLAIPLGSNVVALYRFDTELSGERLTIRGEVEGILTIPC